MKGLKRFPSARTRRKTQDAGRKEEVVFIRFPSREGQGVGLIKCENEC